MAKQVPIQLVVGGEPVFQQDECLDHLTDRRIGFADDCRLGDGGMIGQGTFDLERTDQMSRGLDHIVRAADKPEVSVRVPLGEVTGQVEGVGEALAISGLFVQIAAEHRRPAQPEGEFALDIGLCDDGNRAVVLAAHHVCVHARQRSAHRAGLDVERRRVRDHDAAGLGLPPVVVNRQAQHALSPPDRFGVERLADTGDESQPRKTVLCSKFRAGFDQHPYRGGRGVPHRHILVLQDPVPPLCVELRLVDDRGDAVQQGCDNSVGRPGDPAGIRGAPIDVVTVEV